MRTMKFFAVYLLAIGIIAMCSAKAAQKKTKPRTHEDFCNEAVLTLMAKVGYSGNPELLEEAFKNGEMARELNKDNSTWINPKTKTTEPSVPRGRTKKH